MTTHTSDLTHWQDIERVEGWAGEVRVNLLRMLAILIFYARHLIDVFLSPADSPARGQYHVVATALCVAWATEAIILHIWLTRRQVRPWLKYASAFGDALMITLICAADRTRGPSSPLVLLYFPLVASAALRLSLRLVYATTAAAMLGYLFLLGYYAWYVIGRQTYYASPNLRIPRSTEAITLLALLTTGLFAGQIVRQLRRVVAWRAIVIDDTADQNATTEAAS